MAIKKPPATPEALNLHQRIRAIMKDVTHLVKDGTISFGKVNYKAVTEEAVTSTVRKALIEHGVTCVPTGDIQWNQVGSLNTVIMDYQLTNVDDPKDFLIIPTIGQGSDTQDKGTNKAMTGAFKYLMLRAFNIPTGDDPDKDASKKLDVQNVKDHKKKYDDLLKKHKDLYTPLELKQMAFNSKWNEAKILAITAKVKKNIQTRLADLDVPKVEEQKADTSDVESSAKAEKTVAADQASSESKPKPGAKKAAEKIAKAAEKTGDSVELEI